MIDNTDTETGDAGTDTDAGAPTPMLPADWLESVTSAMREATIDDLRPLIAARARRERGRTGSSAEPAA